MEIDLNQLDYIESILKKYPSHTKAKDIPELNKLPQQSFLYALMIAQGYDVAKALAAVEIQRKKIQDQKLKKLQKK